MALLAADGEWIKVRSSYKIRAGNDWGQVNLSLWVSSSETLGRNVNARDIWRAARPRSGRGGEPDQGDEKPQTDNDNSVVRCQARRRNSIFI